MLRPAIIILLPTLMLAACVLAPPVPEPSDTRVFIVRHAEKLAGEDPGLSPAGRARADALAELLQDEGIVAIFSTDTRRTLQTAAPLAARLGLQTRLYDHRDYPALVEQLAAAGGNVLVVGHSNTIAATAEALGGEGGSEVSEKEYSRLYRVTIPAAGSVTSEIRSYGSN